MFTRFAGYLCCAACMTFAVAQTPPQQPPTQTQTPPPKGNVNPAAPAAEQPGAPNSGTIGAPVDPNSFVIGAEDIIAVNVWRQPDFTRQYLVRPDGRITVPLIGEVQASGLTPAQLAKTLTEDLSKFINNPQVDVGIVTVNSKKYYITGGVLKPGAESLVVPTTVLEALSNAGGFKDFANTKKIVIVRKGKRLKFNYKDVTHGKHMEQNILLQNGDLIIVPE